MLRAAAWTAGLFAVGGGVCHFFPGPWVEPLVLIALGTTLLVVSGRTPGAARHGEAAREARAAMRPARAAR
jgi:hypothetical protein